MCEICGCSDGAHVHVEGEAPHDHEHSHDHGHAHSHGHPHAHPHALPVARTVRLEQDLLAKNDLAAARTRGWLEARETTALNLMSAPGSGKTTLLVRTVRDLGAEIAIGVVEGDQATSRDADRIRAAGARAVQITTGTGCHLEAESVLRALRTLDPPRGSLVFVENVGNLVCPALFDLGELARVVVVSVAEGDDKPAKYPTMFDAADVAVLNKVDLLPYVDFDLARFRGFALAINPKLAIFEVSATRGDGLAAWYDWLRGRHGEGAGRPAR
jgi:hydrogenase nickel incorporation protein HypB